MAHVAERTLHARVLAEGAGIQDNFISACRVRELIACAERRRENGGFRAARIGADRQLQLRDEVRGDQTCWLSDPLHEAERSLLADFERLRLDFNRAAFLGLFDLELHYAWYPPGSAYARHVDQLDGRDQRVVSVVLYLNEAWHPAAGGELRLDSIDGFLDIEPIAGRLVCFLSADREHAVLRTHEDRLSITGWYRRQ